MSGKIIYPANKGFNEVTDGSTGWKYLKVLSAKTEDHYHNHIGNVIVGQLVSKDDRHIVIDQDGHKKFLKGHVSCLSEREFIAFKSGLNTIFKPNEDSATEARKPLYKPEGSKDNRGVATRG